MLPVRSLLSCSNTITCLTPPYICTSLKYFVSAAPPWVLVVGTVGPALQLPKLLMGLFRKLLSVTAKKSVLLILNAENKSQSLKQTNKTTKTQTQPPM